MDLITAEDAQYVCTSACSSTANNRIEVPTSAGAVDRIVEIPKEDERKCLYSFRHPLVITLKLQVRCKCLSSKSDLNFQVSSRI